MENFIHSTDQTWFDSKAKHIIDNGIRHIAAAQLTDGSFTSISSSDPADSSNSIEYKTIFFAAQILGCLSECNAAIPIRNRITTFLLDEKNADWSFNYWARASREYSFLPYPNDLDDTFTALIALAKHDPKLITSEVLSAATKMLITTEKEPGGPYKTWLTNASTTNPAWHDVDIAVNAAVRYFLSLINIRLPKLDAYLDTAIQTREFKSPYYPSTTPVVYFISRSYRDSNARTLAVAILENLLREDINLLDQAMLVSSLLNIGTFPDQVIIASFLNRIEATGWQAYPFCFDPTRNKQKYYAGSSALTAAFCIEAIEKIYKSLASKKNDAVAIPIIISEAKKPHGETSNFASDKYEILLANAKAICNQLPTELRLATITAIEKLVNKDAAMIAYVFRDALPDTNKKLPDALIKKLALGNLYGWIAYDIYDDFLDGEGDPKLLPVANFFKSQLLAIYKALDVEIPGVWRLCLSALENIDAANQWEQAHWYKLRDAKDSPITADIIPDFGDYANLAARSEGYALAALSQLMAAGYSTDSKAYLATEDLFRYYLTARQLHDDAHDWPNDLRRGCINSSGAVTLREYLKQGRTKPTTENILALQKIFWNEIIPTITESIFTNIQAARSARSKMSALDRAQFLEPSLAALEKAAYKTLEERANIKAFLTAYTKNEIFA